MLFGHVSNREGRRKPKKRQKDKTAVRGRELLLSLLLYKVEFRTFSFFTFFAWYSSDLSLFFIRIRRWTTSVFFSDASHNYELIRCSAALFAGCLLIICI